MHVCPDAHLISGTYVILQCDDVSCTYFGAPFKHTNSHKHHRYHAPAEPEGKEAASLKQLQMAPGQDCVKDHVPFEGGRCR